MQREHQAARRQASHRRTSSNTGLEDQGIATPAAIGTAPGLPAAGAVQRLSRQPGRAP